MSLVSDGAAKQADVNNRCRAFIEQWSQMQEYIADGSDEQSTTTNTADHDNNTADHGDKGAGGESDDNAGTSECIIPPGGKHDCVNDSDDLSTDYPEQEQSDSESEDEEWCPTFPRAAPAQQAHRPKHYPHPLLYNACVARPVKPAEVRMNTKAQEALQKEWDRLRKVERPDGKLGVWEESKVMSGKMSEELQDARAVRHTWGSYSAS